MRLGIGTVQFGLDYGVSNTTGKTPPKEAGAILDAARGLGIDVLDTASAYGDSELVLGKFLSPGHGFRLVTKAGPLGNGADQSSDKVREVFLRSLERTGQDKIYGLLAHRASDLLGPHGDGLYAEMRFLAAEGLVRKVGASVYEAGQIDALTSRFDLDLIQVPVSVLDQRLAKSGHLDRLKAAGIEVHARSVFLQGLVFMDPRQMPAYFAPLGPHLVQYRRFLDQAGLTPAQGAFAFIKGVPEIDVVLVGVNTAAQLEANAVDFKMDFPDLDFTSFAVDDPRFVNPANWKLGQ